MKHLKKLYAITVILALCLLAMAGCGSKAETQPPQTTEPTGSTESTYSYSDGIDNTGYWTGITALDHVTLFDYTGISVPAEKHEITDEAIQSSIDELLGKYATTNQVTDRAVADGDTINIDYVGSVDGVEFENGSTKGQGTDVTIGVTSYIDDFLQQLIGHMPGENFDIEVTFPDPYENNPDLAGKDAVFNVTINYISETVNPELTDEFVATNLAETYGWTTVDQLREGTRDKLLQSALTTFMQDYVLEHATVTDLPESMVTYQQQALLKYYQYYATMYNMDLESFVASYVGYESVDALLEANKEENTRAASYYLIIQAIAEDLKITSSEDDVGPYFKEVIGTDDYSSYVTDYGMPYLIQMALNQKVTQHLIDNAVLE